MTFKLIIAGSRDLTGEAWRLLTWDAVNVACVNFGWEPTDILCGMATGIDKHGYDYAAEGGLVIHEHPANWDEHGAAAGPIRNREMAKHADGCIVIHHGSKGSRNMIQVAKDFNVQGLSIELKIF